MARLERLTICGCKRMTEIIADTEETDDMEGEIVFGLLKTLTLDYLPSLSSFYSVKYMIGFPDLESVLVNWCSEMQSFSKNGNIVGSQKLHKVVLDYDRTLSTFSSLINSTISHYWKNHPRTVLQELFTDKKVGYDEEYSEGDDFDDDFEDKTLKKIEHEDDPEKKIHLLHEKDSRTLLCNAGTIKEQQTKRT
ncbi:hypothetical protein FEM48_Zijuj03G0018700 [Ziziphus jujuba var. spinosa]|uniref:Uncharacterized protein n=1 Tax=Ziziphus jujuba var. spinosa TaxID=714518 RepID=A0A978VMG5_ZIZJJ|nr:hypothetical protein FEM48_Zijuj03G0018700 [Ziziphus jujuba var. spinosa]